MAPAAPTPLPAEGGRRERPGQARSAAAAGCVAVSEAVGEAGFGREISDARDERGRREGPGQARQGTGLARLMDARYRGAPSLRVMPT